MKPDSSSRASRATTVLQGPDGHRLVSPPAPAALPVPERSATSRAVTPGLLAAILEQYCLPPFGLHGVRHWSRVLEIGRRLLPLTGARADVLELFSVLHDACRHNENHDPRHGARGALLAGSLCGRAFELDASGLLLLQEACAHHTDGGCDADVTVQTCWDSDRLDLGRAGIWPSPHKLCTRAACDPDLIAWATARSRWDETPDLVLEEWGVSKSLVPGVR
ncbi:MAG TPA: hypothetical protein PLS53_17050 [Thermoanaerobaculaceae bacterium]|nr:hypothetical protein [Thermoanaerobaculaceae bacterium]HPS79871.1 hypothetical protein [Thermoanaerobaculaceae bacterium]